MGRVFFATIAIYSSLVLAISPSLALAQTVTLPNGQTYTPPTAMAPVAVTPYPIYSGIVGTPKNYDTIRVNKLKVFNAEKVAWLKKMTDQRKELIKTAEKLGKIEVVLEKDDLGDPYYLPKIKELLETVSKQIPERKAAGIKVFEASKAAALAIDQEYQVVPPLKYTELQKTLKEQYDALSAEMKTFVANETQYYDLLSKAGSLIPANPPLETVEYRTVVEKIEECSALLKRPELTTLQNLRQRWKPKTG